MTTITITITEDKGGTSINVLAKREPENTFVEFTVTKRLGQLLDKFLTDNRTELELISAMAKRVEKESGIDDMNAEEFFEKVCNTCEKKDECGRENN